MGGCVKPPGRGWGVQTSPTVVWKRGGADQQNCEALISHNVRAVAGSQEIQVEGSEKKGDLRGSGVEPGQNIRHGKEKWRAVLFFNCKP